MSDSKDNPKGTESGLNIKPKLDRKGSIIFGTSERRQKASKSLRRSRSNDAESHQSEDGRGREQDRRQGGKRKRGRSEEGRRRNRDYDNELGNHTKEQPQDDLEDTECIVCFCSFDNIFKTPKLLTCGHTFCLECLARINVNSPEIKTLTCPICREPTEIRHGRDLPKLGNNEDIFRKLPPEMQQALSIRFKRSKGKLVLKKPPTNCPIKTTVNLPVLKKKEEQMGNYPLGVMEEGLRPATMVNVGRPPSRMRGRMRRLLYSNECYYIVVTAIVIVTVSLMLVGIFSFVVIPNMHNHNQNQTSNMP
ncbi:RING finger protein 225-like [Xyrauchen texanus]|uniref:RING finger protein 225-like n=1 Tax=Xyrauchen texanus TaxID=154827 RepID=UPI0022421E69|nr:RING finger protein 225-like [Xyrauchen texanus]